MKTKSKPAAAPKVSAFDKWRVRVQAYCHTLWGRGGFEAMREKTWQRLWGSEARPDLTEWEFAALVVLPYVAHHAVHRDRPELLRKASSFATRRAVRAEQRANAAQTERMKKVFGAAAHAAKLISVPPLPPEPPPEVEVGRWEQPPRNPHPRLRKMYAKSGPPPALKSIGLKDLVIWVENTTDLLADRGEFPTVHCLIDWVHQCPDLDRDEAVLAARRLAALYYAEYEQELEQNRRMFDRAARPPEEVKKKEAKTPKPEKPKPKTEARSDIVTVTGEGDQRKYTVFGHPVTAVLRWMGKDAWTFDDARLAMKRLGIPEVKDNTLKAQLMTGRKGDGYGGRKPAAKLTADQQDRLYALLETADAEEALPARREAEREAPGRQGRGERAAEGKAQAPATRKAEAPAADRGRAGPQPRGTEGRAPRVRPADEPARVRGRTGGADPGEADHKRGVGGKPHKADRPVVQGGDGRGGKNDRQTVGRGTAGKPPVRQPVPGMNGKRRTAPHSRKTAPSRAAKPVGKGTPARTGPKGGKRR